MNNLDYRTAGISDSYMLGRQCGILGRCHCFQLLYLKSDKNGEVRVAGCSALPNWDYEYYHELQANTDLIKWNLRINDDYFDI